MIMSLNELLLMNIYIVSIFAVVVKPKTNHQAYRALKVIITGLSVLFRIELYITGPIAGKWLHTMIMILPMAWILTFFLYGEIVSLLKILGAKTKRFPANVIEEEVKYELMDSIDYLSRHKIGAIITFERANSLEEFINSAFLLGAPLSSELLSSIFYPNTPLHDGAVVIRGNRIVAASCYLPISQNPNISTSFGTRHRAAVGISESNNVFVIVVSEETGRISIARNGALTSGLTIQKLRAEMVEVFGNQKFDDDISFGTSQAEMNLN
jgi:diadenylate cyclase